MQWAHVWHLEPFSSIQEKDDVSVGALHASIIGLSWHLPDLLQSELTTSMGDLQLCPLVCLAQPHKDQRVPCHFCTE